MTLSRDVPQSACLILTFTLCRILLPLHRLAPHLPPRLVHLPPLHLPSPLSLRLPPLRLPPLKLRVPPMVLLPRQLRPLLLHLPPLHLQRQNHPPSRSCKLAP